METKVWQVKVYNFHPSYLHKWSFFFFFFFNKNSCDQSVWSGINWAKITKNEAGDEEILIKPDRYQQLRSSHTLLSVYARWVYCMTLTLLLLSLSPAEFDKFLEERAKAAEMVPTLPVGPTTDPTSAAGSAVNAGNKPDRAENSLFVL